MKKISILLTVLALNMTSYGQNPGLAISEAHINPPGTDSPFEWVELIATKPINFATTPYTVIASNNGTATTAGWTSGGTMTYAFSIASGSVATGDVVYVGGSLMQPIGVQVRSINTLTTNGDGFGVASSGVFGNGGSNADGIAVFDIPVATITPNSVPTDVILYGTGVGGAFLSATDGYQLPVNDLYSGGKIMPMDFVAPDPGSGYLQATGTFNTVSNLWIGNRAFTVMPNFSDGISGINLVTTNPPGFVTVTGTTQTINESAGIIQIPINFTNPNNQEAKVIFTLSNWTNASEGVDFSIQNDTLTIPANQSGAFTFPITLIDDMTSENTERIIVKIASTVNCSVQGNDYQIVFVQDNDVQPIEPSNQIKMELLSSFSNGASGSNSAEIVAYDSLSKRLFIANSIGGKMDILDFSNPALPILIQSLDISPFGGINSIAAHNGLIAVALEGLDPQANGKVYFFDTNGVVLNQVNVGAMPDMITFNKDFTKLLTANEGEPNSSYTIDPEGSVSIIDLSPGVSSLTQTNVTTATFTAFNNQSAILAAQGIRLFPQAASVAQDLEPEYIAISDDNTKAYVTIQENNAIAVIDIATATVTELRALGLSDYSNGNAMDPSDQSSAILIQSLPVKGAYMPDALSFMTIQGTNYLFTANEGDARENNLVVDVSRINGMSLDSVAFPDQHILKNNLFMGRLNVLQVTGDTDLDGDFDELHTLGGRSFSIWDATTGALVFDSKDLLENIIAKDPIFGNLFNASNGGSSTSKNRSDDKGPEPEGITTALIDGNYYAFVGLERIGGVMAFNVNVPTSPVYVGYYNNRSATSNGPDRGTEGLLYIPKEQSPNGNDLLILANEVSSTLSVYQIKTCIELSDVLIAGDLSFCAGSTTQLTTNKASGVTLQWLKDNNSLSGSTDTNLIVNQAGNYSLFVQNPAETCSDTSTKVLVVELDNPTIDLGNDTTLCVSQNTLSLSAGNGFVSYSWSNGGSSSAISINTSGSYSVVVMDTNDCFGADTIEVTFDPCLGLKEQTLINASIYPNPFHSALTVELENKEDATYKFISLTGTVIMNGKISNGKLVLDADSITSGIYLLEIEQNEKTLRSSVQKH